MNSETNAKLSTIRTAVLQVLETCKVAGIVVAVAYGTGPTHTVVLGANEKGDALSADSLFPLSSCTKLPIALAILRLCDRGLLSVDDPLRRFVPDAASAQSGITLKQLLTHTAGLPDYAEGAPAVDQMLDPHRQAQVCLEISPNNTPGTKVVYSDVDYGLLAIAVERITGRKLHAALNELVIKPLGIDAWLGVEPPRLPVYMTDAADKHVGTRLERWNTPEWRALGAPWNSVVATPPAMLAMIRVYQDIPAGFLHPETIVAATQDQTGGLGGGFVGYREWPRCPWGLGPWIFAENMNHFAFPEANPGTFGLGGYSGCVALADPSVEVAWAIHGTHTGATGWTTKGFSQISKAVLASSAN